jgi:hypothetical protein
VSSTVDVNNDGMSNATETSTARRREDNHQEQGGEDRREKLDTDESETLSDGNLSGDNGGEGNGGVEVSTRDIGKGVDQSDTTEGSGDGGQNKVFRILLTSVVDTSGLNNEHKEEGTKTFTKNGTQQLNSSK